MNLQNIMSEYQNFLRSPQQYLTGIPQNIANNPDQIIEYLMSQGIVSQNAYNYAVQLANQIKPNQYR